MPTQTVTYDPANDTIIEEQDAARDAENLEVGEKLVTEQENLLAGKYKTTEDLESAYKELEKKLGDKEQGLEREASEETTDEPQQLDPATFYKEDGSVNYDVANEVYGEQVSNIFKNAEIDPFKMNEHFMENNGTLSEDMYETLGKAGLNKSIVDSYLEGVRQQTGYDSSQPDAVAPSLNEQEVTELKGIAGGDKGYEALMSWATDNLSDADAKNFDEVIETGNKAAVTFAVKALMGQYEDAQGRDSTLITGKQSPTPTYRSMAEVVRDMNNPLYDNDESYRDDVRRKLELSNLKV